MIVRGGRRTAILVTGTRVFSQLLQEKVFYALQPYRLRSYVIVLHGGATGADTCAARLCKHFRYIDWPLPYFGDLGKAGGYARNAALVDTLTMFQTHQFECVAEAFPDDESKGTPHCIRLLERAGFKPNVHEMGPRIHDGHQRR